MARSRKKSRRYSDDERASALAALAANGGNVNRAAKEIGIPHDTLRRWSRGERHPEARQMSDGKKLPLADAIESVVEKMVEAVGGKIENAPLQQLATAIGILIDKMLLLRAPKGEGSGATPGSVPVELVTRMFAVLGTRSQPGGPGSASVTLPVASETGGAVGGVAQ